MSATFVFTEEAENQLLDIIDFISAESEDAAVPRPPAAGL